MKKTISALCLMALLTACDKKNKTQPEVQAQETTAAVPEGKLSFPMSNSFSESYLKENFINLSYDKAGEELQYFIIVPRYIKPTALEPKAVDGAVFFNIGQFRSLNVKDPQMEVFVYYQHVDGAVQPADWVKEKLILSGHTIVHQKEMISSKGNTYIDVLSKGTDGVVARTTEFVNAKGDYMMLSVFCRESEYEKLAETIQLITSNWGLGMGH